MDAVDRQGHRLPVLDLGPADGDPIVLLHGFPGSQSTWAEVAPRLADSGYRVLAPTQRGYAASARPAGRRPYRLTELVADIVALLDQAGLERAHVVGHDWGGGVAWQLAAAQPSRCTRLTALSTPHPRAMLRAAVTSTQALRSWYMGVFQIPWLPEALLLRSEGAALRRALEAGGLGSTRAAAYATDLADPGAVTGALAWYRALPFAGPPAGPVRVPTHLVWGDGDRYLGPAGAELTARYVTAPYRLTVMEGAGHFLPEEHPDEVARHIAADR